MSPKKGSTYNNIVLTRFDDEQFHFLQNIVANKKIKMAKAVRQCIDSMRFISEFGSLSPEQIAKIKEATKNGAEEKNARRKK